MRRFFIATLVLLSGLTAAQSYAERFDTAWRLVDERYWNVSEHVDWLSVRERYEPRALAATSDRAFYKVLEEMYGELGDQHSVFVPPDRVTEIRESYGDLPCLGIFAQRDLKQRGTISYELLDGEIGYIDVPDLVSTNVAVNIRFAANQLLRQQAKAFILDLRGNPGGRLIEMMQVAGIFTGGFLWRTVTRWTLPIPYPAVGTTVTDLPLVILIDKDVNSAAEGLAGALQHRERATIIGETSAGNVEAILPFCLRDGSQAWIATGVLAPIGGPTWEGRGVVPDIASDPQDALKVALEHLKAR